MIRRSLHLIASLILFATLAIVSNLFVINPDAISAPSGTSYVNNLVILGTCTGCAGSLASPGPIGGTTSSTGQFTQLAVGASVPALPGTIGDAIFTESGSNQSAIIKGLSGTGAQFCGLSGACFTILPSAPNSFSANGNLQTASNGIMFIPPQPLANFSACAAGTEGGMATQTNSTAACSAGTTATTGGTTHCQIYCNGTNWVQTGR